LDFIRLVTNAEAMLEHRRPIAARNTYLKCLESWPEHASLLRYNLGALERSETGNGLKAREYFTTVAAGPRDDDAARSNPETMRQLLANSYENLMVLSLSYEEYYSWADKLESLQPDNPILTVNRPDTKQAEDRGHPWRACLETLTAGYWNQDHSADPGQYGNAASTFHLLLHHRSKLRLSRDQQTGAAFMYSASIARVHSACGMAMQSRYGFVNRADFDDIAAEAIPFVKDYCDHDPSDLQALKGLTLLQSCLVRS